MRSLRHPMADAFHRKGFRPRPGPIIVHPLAAGRSAHHRQPPVFPPDALTDASRTVTDEILRELLPCRRARANPRVVKRKMPVYQVDTRTTATRPSSPTTQPLPLK